MFTQIARNCNVRHSRTADHAAKILQLLEPSFVLHSRFYDKVHETQSWKEKGTQLWGNRYDHLRKARLHRSHHQQRSDGFQYNRNHTDHCRAVQLGQASCTIAGFSAIASPFEGIPTVSGNIYRSLLFIPGDSIYRELLSVRGFVFLN